jgi:glycosyltransferase involved in cell wall biosynthesis
MNKKSENKPILAYLVTEDWYFLSHRLPMALAAQRAGYDVHVLTHCDRDAAKIASHGFQVHDLPWRRGSANPVNVCRVVWKIRSVYRELKPELVHHIALEPCLIGSMAAYGLPMARVNAVTGLGSIFTAGSLKARFVRYAVSRLLKWTLTQPGSVGLLQNPDDCATIAALGIPANRIELIPGSGVDTDELVPLPEPPTPITIGFVGRLLVDKGLYPLVEAFDLLAQRGVDVRLVIAGSADPANPSSVSPADLAVWKERAGIAFLGHVADIRTVWQVAHIAVLPSRREGLPKSLLEAAACGRPIVATDVPGCREIARDNVNALLVPPENAVALADALERLVRDGKLRRQFGKAGREIVKSEHSSPTIGAAITKLYDRLLVPERIKSRRVASSAAG